MRYFDSDAVCQNVVDKKVQYLPPNVVDWKCDVAENVNNQVRQTFYRNLIS